MFIATDQAIPVWFMGFLVLGAWLAVKNVRDIRASNERLKDPVYRRELERMGLLRPRR